MSNEIIFYKSSQGNVRVEVVYVDENFWLSQKQMAELFHVEVHTVNYHLKEIFKSGELNEDSVIRKIRITAQDGKILKSDVTVAKNYLNEKHIKELERIVSAFLDLAENRAERQILMKMENWILFLDQFLELASYPILEDKGKISALEAKIKAEQEYEVYRKEQDINYISDFDKEIKRLKGN